MTQQGQGSRGSRQKSQVAAEGLPHGAGSTAADRKADRASGAWAVLDRLRDVAAAHDGDRPALKMPEPPRRRSS
jgi:hypothetical protein